MAYTTPGWHGEVWFGNGCTIGEKVTFEGRCEIGDDSHLSGVCRIVRSKIGMVGNGEGVRVNTCDFLDSNIERGTILQLSDLDNSDVGEGAIVNSSKLKSATVTRGSMVVNSDDDSTVGARRGRTSGGYHSPQTSVFRDNRHQGQTGLPVCGGSEETPLHSRAANLTTEVSQGPDGWDDTSTETSGMSSSPSEDMNTEDQGNTAHNPPYSSSNRFVAHLPNMTVSFGPSCSTGGQNIRGQVISGGVFNLGASSGDSYDNSGRSDTQSNQSRNYNQSGNPSSRFYNFYGTGTQNLHFGRGNVNINDTSDNQFTNFQGNTFTFPPSSRSSNPNDPSGRNRRD